MQQQPGILIARPDGVVVVPNAIPVSRALVAGVEYLLDSLGAPARRPEARGDRPESGRMAP